MILSNICLVIEKLDVCTNKDIDIQPPQNTVSKQKEIFKLLEKDVFKVHTLDKIVKSEDILSNT